MLKAVNLSKNYNGLQALEGFNLEIAAGEIYCLLGAGGSGKSTVIKLFLNSEFPSGGEAFINNISVAREPLETKKYLAYIPRRVNLYENLTGLENLEFFCSVAGRDMYSKHELRAFLVGAGLQPEWIEERVTGYSKGMRQKVGIAIATAKQAKVLLLDEPTSGLDPKASDEFSELLKKLSGAGCAVLMATRDTFRARESGTRIGIIRRGKLLTEMKAEELGHTDLDSIYLRQMSNQNARRQRNLS